MAIVGRERYCEAKGEGAVVECLKVVARDEYEALVDITDLLEKMNLFLA